MKRRTALATGIAGAAGAASLGMSWLLHRSSEGQADPRGASLRHWPNLQVHDLAGRVLQMPVRTPAPRIVNVWARWCPPCRRELPSLQRMAERLRPQGVEVIALALDDDAFALREYVAEQRLALAVLRHAAAAHHLLPGTEALPQTYALAPKGRVLARWTGAREWDSPAQIERVRRVLEGVA